MHEGDPLIRTVRTHTYVHTTLRTYIRMYILKDVDSATTTLYVHAVGMGLVSPD